MSIVTAPLKWADRAIRIQMAGHLNRMAERVSAIPSARVVKARPEIAVPVLEKLRHTAEPVLADMFIELLGKACDAEGVFAAHPAFPNIIGSLTPDEAHFLQILKANETVPWAQALSVKGDHPNQGWKAIDRRRIDKAHSRLFAYPQNEAAYMGNLEGLGLMENVDVPILGKSFHDEFEASCRSNAKLMQRVPQGEALGLSSGHVKLSDFGRLFMKACTP
jgi:hypothetical protein